MNNFFTFILLLLFPIGIFGQNFHEVDAHATSVKASEDIKSTVDELIAPFDDDIEKVRSIFTWLATNVSYDCKELHRNVADRKARTRPELRDRTFEKKTAICAGYAVLFDIMCEEAGINAELVSGYARVGARAPSPDRLRSNHAWNAVEIDGEWHLVDVTWAAGYTDGEVKKFTFSFDDRYFMTQPDLFFQQHWPEDAKWQLLEKELTAEDFSALPHFYKLFPGMQVHSFSPEKGVLNDTEEEYHFRIHLEGADQVYFGMGTRMFDMSEKEEDVYEFSIIKDDVRGRKFVIAAKKEDIIRVVMEYRLQ